MTTEELLDKHFKIDGDVTINPSTGLIDVNSARTATLSVFSYSISSVRLKSEIKVSELPVKFGKVTIDFDCSRNELTSLMGSPHTVEGNFLCDNNKLTSLIGAPQLVYDNFVCFNNPLRSLDGLPKIVKGEIGLTYKRKLPLLKLFMVKELKNMYFFYNKNYQTTPEAKEVKSLLDQFLPFGTKGMLPCAAELIKAGYRDNARL